MILYDYPILTLKEKGGEGRKNPRTLEGNNKKQKKSVEEVIVSRMMHKRVWKGMP